MAGIIKSLGICGWEKIEPLILATIASRHSLLFKGNPGCAKTYSAEVLSKAAVGGNCVFRHYETPSLNFDDIPGVLNPHKLKDGEIDFVHTPFSIWKAQAALFDEINGCNPFMQVKLHELIRQKKFMGYPTQLQLVFGALNPPDEFFTPNLTYPHASRWVVCDVPKLCEMATSDRNKVIEEILLTVDDPSSSMVPDLSSKFKEARAVALSKQDQKRLVQMLQKLVQTLYEVGFKHYEGRSIKLLRDLIVAYQGCRKAFGSDFLHDDNAITSIVVATIPELSGLVKMKSGGLSEQERLSAINRIATVITAMQLGDPNTLATTLDGMMKLKVSDNLSWGNNCVALMSDEVDLGLLRRSGKMLKDKDDVEQGVKTSVMRALLHRYSWLEINDKKLVFSKQADFDAYISKLKTKIFG